MASNAAPFRSSRVCCADLDFGIYRIMNHKRDVIERFISTKLPEAVEAELSSGTLAERPPAQGRQERRGNKALRR